MLVINEQSFMDTSRISKLLWNAKPFSLNYIIRCLLWLLPHFMNLQQTHFWWKERCHNFLRTKLLLQMWKPGINHGAGRRPQVLILAIWPSPKVHYAFLDLRKPTYYLYNLTWGCTHEFPIHLHRSFLMFEENFINTLFYEFFDCLKYFNKNQKYFRRGEPHVTRRTPDYFL